MKILDLFSGIGGFSYGFESTGCFETIRFCEIDPHARRVLMKHWPDVYIEEDVSKLDGKELAGKVDVICGGFPCQDISVAGQQRGINEETRSGLWFQYKRLIKEIRPKWVVIENVRNLLSNGLATVLQDLSEIGYDAEWEVISARDVGACHLRERVWIVAYPRCRQWGPGHTGNSEKLRGGPSNGKKIRTSDAPEIEGSGIGRQTTSGGMDKFESTFSEGQRVQGLRSGGEQEPYTYGAKGLSMCSSKERTSLFESTYPDNFRFWPSFTSEKEKQQWWTETTASFRHWWQVESTICRVDDGLPPRLDKGRAQRIKQLGNSIVPQIAYVIANRILEVEI